MRRVLVPLADGVEEMEAVTIIDTLRRAGWEVVSVSVCREKVTGSRGVELLADSLWEALDPADFDVLTIPGGAGGTAILAAHDAVLSTVRDFATATTKILAAICAGPMVLATAGALDGRRFTCHPSVRAQIRAGTYQDEPVVVDGLLVTSQGPGTALRFALALIELGSGKEQATEVGAGMLA